MLATLPATGWTEGLFGRRDALLLYLLCIVGIPSASVAELACGDLAFTPEMTIIIAGDVQAEIPVDPDNPWGVLPIWQRSMAVRNLLVASAGPTRLAGPLTQAPCVTDHTAVRLIAPPVAAPDAALFPAFDRWGNPRALRARSESGLSASAIRDVAAIVLTGRRVASDRDEWGRAQARTPQSDGLTELHHDHVIDLPDNHDAGIHARRAALSVVNDADIAYLDIDRQAAKLLERTERLLARFTDSAVT